MDIDGMSPMQKALLALTVAAEQFFTATCAALDEKHPGRGAQDRALLDEGRAHLCISIQAGSGRVEASLALVAPEFVKTLAAPELTLYGSLASIFGDPGEVKITDIGGLH